MVLDIDGLKKAATVGFLVVCCFLPFISSQQCDIFDVKNNDQSLLTCNFRDLNIVRTGLSFAMNNITIRREITSSEVNKIHITRSGGKYRKQNKKATRKQNRCRNKKFGKRKITKRRNCDGRVVEMTTFAACEGSHQMLLSDTKRCMYIPIVASFGNNVSIVVSCVMVRAPHQRTVHLSEV